MAFMQVRRYSLIIRTSAGSDGTSPPPLLKVIRMLPVPAVGDGDAVEYAEFLYPRQLPREPGEAPGRRVFGVFPPEEFEIHRRILQTESPVFVDWTVDPSNQPFLTNVLLRTAAEPIGEGPTDADA